MSIQESMQSTSLSRNSRRKEIIPKIFLIISDALALILAYFFAVEILPAELGAQKSTFTATFYALALTCMALFIVKGHYSKRIPFWDELRQMLKGIILVALLHMMVVSLLGIDSSKAAVIYVWTSALILPFMRMGAKILLIKSKIWLKSTVIIGDGNNALETAKALADERMMGYQITQFLSIDEPKVNEIEVNGALLKVTQLSEDLKTHLNKLGNPHVVVALERGGLDRIQKYVDQLSLFYPSISVVPALRGLPLFGADMHSFFSHEVILLNLRNNLRPLPNRIIKRSFDIFGSLALLAILSPLFIFVVRKIKKSGGSAFFAHTRIGREGKEFPCYKFRSMVPNAQEVLQDLLKNDPEARAEWEKDFKLKNDPRITPIGHFLRKTSLDELPQLWNVLRGEMSLVGPRPVIQEEIERYGDKAVHYLQAKPGMTGLWQVSGRNDIDYDSRVYLDAWYVKNWNLWTDIVILFKTIGVVLNRDGAY